MNKILQVRFRCITCEGVNKQYLNSEGYTPRETIYESLSDAWEHFSSNQFWHHWIIAEVEIDNE